MSKSDIEESARFFPEVEELLRQSGWYPCRQVEESQMEKWYAFNWVNCTGYCRMFPAAYRILREFGGLRIVQDAPGVDLYRHSFVLDPLTALDSEENAWISYEWLLETSLYPIGSYCGFRSDGTFAIDLQGAIWWIYDGNFSLTGKGIDEALNNLMRGIDNRDSKSLGEDMEKWQPAVKVRKAVERLYNQTN